MVLRKWSSASRFGDHLCLVSIGVNSVTGNWLPVLLTPEADAERIAKILSDTKSCGAHRVECLTGEATSARVLSALRQAVSSCDPDDTLVIFFAGHGIEVASEFYFVVREQSRFHVTLR